MAKILVVNNDFDTMSLLQSLLERKKYQVKYTSDGEEVPRMMKDFKPDVVLIDVLQNKVAEELKADNKTTKVPIILMTGYTLGSDNYSIHSDDVIEKPFNLELLEKKIEKLLN